MYNVIILRLTRKALARLPDAEYVRVLAAIEALANDPRPSGCRKLINSPYWRIRVGDYRVIYEIETVARGECAKRGAPTRCVPVMRCSTIF